MKLAAWLEANAVSEPEFAERIKRSREAVRRYANGDRIPDRTTMPIIVEATGGQVTPNDFFATTTPDPAPPQKRDARGKLIPRGFEHLTQKEIEALPSIPFPGAIEKYGELSIPAMDESLDSIETVLRSLSASGVAGAQDLLGAMPPFRTDIKAVLTIRASKERLGVDCSERFLEFVAAVRALDRDGRVIDWTERHGWPILSLRGGTATVPVGDGESTPSSADTAAISDPAPPPFPDAPHRHRRTAPGPDAPRTESKEVAHPDASAGCSSERPTASCSPSSSASSGSCESGAGGSETVGVAGEVA